MTVSVQCQVNWKIETKGLSHSAYKQVFQFIMAIVSLQLKVRVVSIDLYISHNFKRSSTWITNLVPKPSRQAVRSKDLRWSEGFSYWIDQSDIFGYKAYLAFSLFQYRYIGLTGYLQPTRISFNNFSKDNLTGENCDMTSPSLLRLSDRRPYRCRPADAYIVNYIPVRCYIILYLAFLLLG